jgi:hypothetical protein
LKCCKKKYLCAYSFLIFLAPSNDVT